MHVKHWKRNFVKFAAAYRKAYAAPVSVQYIAYQFKLLVAGHRGVEVSDAACVAWLEIGNSV